MAVADAIIARLRRASASLIVVVAGLGCGSPAPPADDGHTGSGARAAIKPVRQTETLPNDPDDPAFWIHPNDISRSLILGTDKVESKGGLYVFDLDGTLRQSITPLDRPNNVDVEYGVRLGDRLIDIAVLTERKQQRLRVFGIASDSAWLTDLASAGLPVLEGESGEASEPMGSWL